MRRLSTACSHPVLPGYAGCWVASGDGAAATPRARDAEGSADGVAATPRARDADTRGSSSRSTSAFFEAGRVEDRVRRPQVRGGWLEFLGSVRLRENETFDAAAELARAAPAAADAAVGARVAAAVADALGEDASSDVVDELCASTTQRLEQGLDGRGASRAAFAAAAQWFDERSRAERAVADAAPDLDECDVKRLGESLALRVRRRQEAVLEAAASRAAAEFRRRRARERAASLLPADLDDDARAYGLRRLLEREGASADAVLAEWRDVSRTFAERAEDLAARRRARSGGPALDAGSVSRKARNAYSKGAPVDEAFRETVEKADAAARASAVAAAVTPMLEPAPGGWVFGSPRRAAESESSSRRTLVSTVAARFERVASPYLRVPHA